MSNQQNKNSDDAKIVADLILRISSGELTDSELKDAKKVLILIQQRTTKAIQELKNRLPVLTPREQTLLKSQKLTLGELVIDQVFAESSSAKDALTVAERQQFLALVLKLIKRQSKSIEKKILQDSDCLEKGLYLHSENARKAKLNIEVKS